MNLIDRVKAFLKSFGEGTAVEKKARNQFIKFLGIVCVGMVIGFLGIRRGLEMTPDGFRNLVLSLGIAGPLLYTFLFFIRPFFILPSIAMFIAGGLAFGPVWGPFYASVGTAVGGSLAFWVARKMGYEFVAGKIKVGREFIDNTRFSFTAVLVFSLFPVMPITLVNYGSGLSGISFRSYLPAHVIGLAPRIFTYGFFGSSLLEIGSFKFQLAGALVLTMFVLAFFLRKHLKGTQKTTSV